MPTGVLDRARDAEREVELRRHGLARTAHLALQRQPAGVADRPRRGQLGVERFGQLLGQRQLVLLADAAPDGHDALGLREVDGLLGLAERRLGLLPNRGGVDVGRDGGHGSRRRAALDRLIGRERADLARDEVRRVPFRQHVGGQLALEHEARERRPALGLGQADDVGDERRVEAGGELGHEVARLIGVRRTPRKRGARLADERRERADVAVGRVALERRRARRPAPRPPRRPPVPRRPRRRPIRARPP